MIKLAMLKEKSRLSDNGYTYKEEMEIFTECLKFVYENPRFVLDNMYKWRDFKVSWHNYKTKTPVSYPKKHSFIKDSSPIYKK